MSIIEEQGACQEISDDSTGFSRLAGTRFVLPHCPRSKPDGKKSASAQGKTGFDPFDEALDDFVAWPRALILPPFYPLKIQKGEKGFNHT